MLPSRRVESSLFLDYGLFVVILPRHTAIFRVQLLVQNDANGTPLRSHPYIPFLEATCTEHALIERLIGGCSPRSIDRILDGAIAVHTFFRTFVHHSRSIAHSRKEAGHPSDGHEVG